MQHAIVPKQLEARVNSGPAIGEQIQRLASLEPSDADFLSCYFHLDDGSAACLAHLDAQAKRLRSACGGTVRLDLEQALEMAESALRALFDEQSPLPAAVAIFARGLEGQGHLTVVRLNRPVEPAVTLYRIPDLTQLWIDRRPDECFALVLARRGGIQVLDVQGGDVVSRAWASYRVDRGKQGGGAIAIPQQRLKVLRRSLNGQSDTPIVVAGDGNCLDGLTAALPARVLKRLRDVMRIPSHLDTQSAVDFVARRLATRRDLYNQQAAARLLRAVENNGLAVSGATASHAALRTGAAELLVVARPHVFEAAWQCDECGAVGAGVPLRGCSRCDTVDLRDWDPAIELVRLACQQDIPVVSTGDTLMSQLGGVACLLREPVEIEVMPHPAVPQSAALDLVA